MNPKVQKGAFIVLIILLCIFVPLAGAGVYFKLTSSSKTTSLENTNKDFFFDNKLWFYSESDGSLLGTYECENPICGYALSTNNDQEYGINSYLLEEESTIKLYNNRFAVLRDTKDLSNNEVFVYDLTTQTAYKQLPYTEVNNYGVGIDGNLLIARNESNKYGVLSLENMMNIFIPFEYEYIALKNDVNEEGKVLADYFIVLKDGSWYLIDRSGAILTEKIADPIIDYTGTYLITRNINGIYHLVNYSNAPVLEGDFANLSFTDKYVNCMTQNQEFYVYNIAERRIVSQTYTLKEGDKVFTEVDINNQIIISINDQVVETISV